MVSQSQGAAGEEVPGRFSRVGARAGRHRLERAAVQAPDPFEDGVLAVPSPFNKYRDRVCKSIEMTGFYHTILKCPDTWS